MEPIYATSAIGTVVTAAEIEALGKEPNYWAVVSESGSILGTYKVHSLAEAALRKGYGPEGRVVRNQESIDWHVHLTSLRVKALAEAEENE